MSAVATHWNRRRRCSRSAGHALHDPRRVSGIGIHEANVVRALRVGYRSRGRFMARISRRQKIISKDSTPPRFLANCRWQCYRELHEYNRRHWQASDSAAQPQAFAPGRQPGARRAVAARIAWRPGAGRSAAARAQLRPGEILHPAVHVGRPGSSRHLGPEARRAGRSVAASFAPSPPACPASASASTSRCCLTVPTNCALSGR